jgi:hypothetical protein
VEGCGTTGSWAAVTLGEGGGERYQEKFCCIPCSIGLKAAPMNVIGLQAVAAKRKENSIKTTGSAISCPRPSTTSITTKDAPRRRVQVAALFPSAIVVGRRET